MRRLAIVLALILYCSTAQAAVIGKRPPQCPRLYCGCALSIKIFGKPIRDLFLAANWKRFPQTSPAPGMVAARRGHVFQLVRHIKGDTWLAWDANSGRGLTRIHPRRIAGFTIHKPVRLASN